MTTHVFKPDMPPPRNRIGIVAWARANLFSSAFNTVLTLLACYLVWLIVPPLLQHPQIHIDTLSQLSWEHGNMQKLLRGRIDAALFSNDISANHFRARLSAVTRLIYLPVTPLEVHIVLTKSLGDANPELVQHMRQVVERVPLASLVESTPRLWGR